ncbi:MAG: PilN domain-containing protein [Porticoccaceae bacterium]|nr:PilN domain-containing protein [Porticoccaceae bacterium]
MANINLLSWREDMRQEKKKAFVSAMAITFVVGLAAAFLWGQYVQSQTDTQNQRNGVLTGAINALAKDVEEIKNLKMRRKQVLERMAVIQSLQSARPDIVKVYDEFVRVIPDGVYIDSVARVGDDISLAGYAESNNRISSFMRQLDGSYKFSDPNLIKVNADATLGEQGNRFDLRVKIKAVNNGELDLKAAGK